MKYPLSTAFAIIGIIVAASGKDYTWQEMLKTGTFWVLLATYVCATTAGIMLIRSISDMTQKQIRVTVTVAAFAVSISTIANFVGRLAFGTFFDKLGPFKSLYAIFATSIIALLIMATAKTWAMFILCLSFD